RQLVEHRIPWLRRRSLLERQAPLEQRVRWAVFGPHAKRLLEGRDRLRPYGRPVCRESVGIERHRLAVFGSDAGSSGRDELVDLDRLLASLDPHQVDLPEDELVVGETCRVLTDQDVGSVNLVETLQAR